jgi:hypothetical protein
MFYAMCAMILLTCVVAGRLLALRVAAVKSGEVKLSAFRLNNNADMPGHLQQAARNFSNLFEMPMLFYVGSTLALALHLETTAMAVLAWLFVASRALHSWIHMTGNNVIRRMQAFMFGNACLLLMWCLIAWQYTAQGR